MRLHLELRRKRQLLVNIDAIVNAYDETKNSSIRQSDEDGPIESAN